MQNNSIHILCTRPIDASLVKSCKEKGIEIDILSFIHTEPIENIEVQQEIETALLLSATIVFTSMNAVEAVAQYIFDTAPDWRIYCIGHSTAGLVKKYFGEEAIAGTADNSFLLADLVLEDALQEEVIFFCGDQRRDELPNKLRANAVEVTEIVVYETVAVPRKITRSYQGILFFSPSAVKAFFSINKTGDQTVFFAIGETTALAIRGFSNNRVIVADEPGKEQLVETMLQYFT